MSEVMKRIGVNRGPAWLTSSPETQEGIVGTSLKDIAGWWENGKEQKAAFMIVVCDSFDHEDYPVYTTREDFWSKYQHYDGKNMQRIMEVYDYGKSWQSQTSGRVWNTPPKEVIENE
jgi:hypothetical protein